MKLARLQVQELAVPVVALLRDGAYYDVAVLEELWGVRPPGQAAPGFHARVVSARGSGLDQLDARLSRGVRPTEARVMDVDLLPLAPCASERGSYLQLGPVGVDSPLRVERRDRRALLGDGQPIVLPPGVTSATVEVGIGVLLGDDLDGANPRQAERAVIGITPLLDWAGRADWSTPRWEPVAQTQIGPALLTGASMRAALSKSMKVRLPYRAAALPLALDQPIAARVAALSRLVPLYAGDLVGVGCLPGGRLLCSFGDMLILQLAGVPPLRGWALPARGALPPCGQAKLPSG